jgi:carbonic anhydrase
MIRSLLYFVLSFCLAAGLNAHPLPSAQTSSTTSQQDLLNETLNFARSHQDFRDLHFKQHEAEFVRLIKEGQNPKILFIGCSDSRVVPELILNARPGDIFVIRTAGNFVPPFLPQSADGVSATLQFAVEVLNVPHIIVCGHSHCGAIRGLFQDLDPTKLGILKQWIKLGEDAKHLTMQTAKPNTPQEDIYVTAEEINVLVQLEHLMSFPFVKKAVNEGKIALHGWYFDIERGNLLYYDTEKNRFVPLIEKGATGTTGELKKAA